MPRMVDLISVINQYQYSKPPIFNNKVKITSLVFENNHRFIILRLFVMEKSSMPEKRQKNRYIREELMLASFILHAHTNLSIKEYISCDCDHQCIYVLMNDIRRVQNQVHGDFDQKQLFQQSKNSGYPQSLEKLVYKQNISMLDFLVQIYSTYMHLEIQHSIVAELLISIKFQTQEEKQYFVESCQGNKMAIIFQEDNITFKFTIFTYKIHPNKSVFQKVVYVIKDGQTLQQNEKIVSRLKSKLVVSQNQWIVIFWWLLTTKSNFNSFNGPYYLSYQKLIDALRAKSSILQKKLNQIRKRSFTRLYDFSIFVTDFE